MSNQTRFGIDININGGESSPTTPSRDTSYKNPMTISGTLKNIGMENVALGSAVIASTASLGKTYIDLQFNKSENINQGKRFNFALKATGYIGTIVGGAKFGPVGVGVGTAVVGLSVLSDVFSYNTQLEKTQIKFNYTNKKFNQSITNGSRN
jgi:hypothetical protein